MKKKQKIVLYDADCGFCNFCKNFSLKRNHSLTFIDIKSQEASAILEEKSIKKNLYTIFYFEEEKVFKKSEAVARIFKTFGLFWKLFYFLWKIIPKKLSDFLYDFVSKNKNIFFKNKTCKIK
jgi:predicted DCC family thiol-disulfide oxidoreductase YuxK